MNVFHCNSITLHCIWWSWFQIHSPHNMLGSHLLSAVAHNCRALIRSPLRQETFTSALHPPFTALQPPLSQLCTPTTFTALSYSPVMMRHWKPWSTNMHHTPMLSSMLIWMLRGTIHGARSRNRKHGGWNEYIEGRRAKNLSKPGAHNLSTYDSYFENNTRNTGPGRYPRTWRILQHFGRKSGYLSINPRRHRTVNFLQMNLQTFWQTFIGASTIRQRLKS